MQILGYVCGNKKITKHKFTNYLDTVYCYKREKILHPFVHQTEMLISIVASKDRVVKYTCTLSNRDLTQTTTATTTRTKPRKGFNEQYNSSGRTLSTLVYFLPVLCKETTINHQIRCSLDNVSHDLSQQFFSSKFQREFLKQRIYSAGDQFGH